MRAELERPHTPDGDPGAQAQLCAGMRPSRRVRREAIATRTAFFDQQVLAAIDAAIGQVVILGAGYDDRALRFRSPGTRYFELDHPATQRDKRRRLRRIGADTRSLTLAPADFRVDAPASVLAACGHDGSRPSLFICEGLLAYLDEGTTVDLLRSLRSCAAAGSRLAVSLAVHDAAASSNEVVSAANARRRHAGSEPWQTILPVNEQLTLLARAGWEVVSSRGSPQAAVRAQRAMLLVLARPA